MTPRRWFFLAVGMAMIAVAYLFQHSFNPWKLLHGESPWGLDQDLGIVVRQPAEFVLVKVMRYLINDMGAMAIIYGLFGAGRYLKFSVWVMLFGGLVLLPLYLVLKIYEGPGMSAILQQLHRLTVNPVLMLVLIPAFYYQQLLEKRKGE